MAIYRWVKDAEPRRDDGGQDREAVADFSYQSDALAQLIVDAWVRDDFRNQLLSDKAFAKTSLAQRGISLANPVIISEEKYRRGEHTMEAENEVVFVIPDGRRVDVNQPTALLETARFLMACVPNGI